MTGTIRALTQTGAARLRQRVSEVLNAVYPLLRRPHSQSPTPTLSAYLSSIPSTTTVGTVALWQNAVVPLRSWFPEHTADERICPTLRLA